MSLRVRHAARAVVLDPDGRVLLTRFAFRDGRVVWTTVGGGLEEGETHEDAIRRELVEEAGLHVEELGPCIWVRDHVIPDPVSFDVQSERYFLVRTAAFEPVPALSWSALEAEGMTDLRWWSVEEILAATETRFGPRSLGSLLGDLLRNGPPSAPLPVGV